MNMKSETMMRNKPNVWNVFSFLFGIVAFGIGVINTFWGNDPGFGVFIILLSLVYVPRLTAILKEKTGFTISGIVKFILAIFILWASLGVGELFDKIDMMMTDVS